MPRSTLPEDYPPEYPMLLQKAFVESDKKSYYLSLPEGSMSVGLVRKLYAYFAALKGSPEHARLALMASQLTLKAMPCAVLFTRKRHQWDATAIRSALGLPEDFADLAPPIIPEAHTTPARQAVPSESPLAKLKDIRKRTGKT